MVRGVWSPQTAALLDVRVVDTDAPSNMKLETRQVLKKNEEEKKRHLGEACVERRAHFTPFVVSVDGAFGAEANTFLSQIARKLVLKWEMKYSQVMRWVRTRMSFAVLRATNACVRGSRVRWRSVREVDAAGVWMMR
eukprot:GHVN01093213.1.p1 GENE.GHVN01093213.1~~GHVN01093213.1.p1  ORF type:complete len:137 (+),score=20.63 GHVN01093213.1:337-747(+)